jgi:hypothetical protein
VQCSINRLTEHALCGSLPFLSYPEDPSRHFYDPDGHDHDDGADARERQKSVLRRAHQFRALPPSLPEPPLIS